MHIDTQFKELVEEKYNEAKEKGLTDIIIDEPVLGELRLFINKKPVFVITEFISGEDTLYIGAEELTPTS